MSSQNNTKSPVGRRPNWFASLLKLRFFSDDQPKISPHAIVARTAELADDVEVGPFCVIGPHVKLGKGCRLLSSVTILGRTTVGRDNIFFPNSVIGATPQDKKFRGEDTRLEIGDSNLIREAVTIHLGTEKGGGITRVGSNNLLMVNAHLGHDVQMGDNCVLANNVMVAGHVVIGDYVSMMGGVGVHHKVTIGDHAYIGGYAKVRHDVPPYVKIDGADGVRGVNTVGLRRAGFNSSDIDALVEVTRELFLRKKRRPLSVQLAEFDLDDPKLNPHVRAMVAFLRRRDLGKNGRYLDGVRPTRLDSPSEANGLVEAPAPVVWAAASASSNGPAH
jgi:UDP-N-acetylglucosamine acyltransferase